MSFMLFMVLFTTPPLFLFADLFDFLEGVEPSLVDAGAAHRRVVPGVRAVEIVFPEWPGAALIGTHRVNSATAATALFRGQEDTVLGSRLFFDTAAAAVLFEIFFGCFVNRYAEMFSHKLYFGLGNPDIALFRPRTAVAAAGTFKIQPADIPFHCHIILSRFFEPRMDTNEH